MVRFIYYTALLMWTLIPSIWSQIPRTMSYQGTLSVLSGQKVADDIYNIVFRLYDAAGQGNVLWQEEQHVQILDGSFSVMLGAKSPIVLNFDKPYWLGVTVLPGEEIQPRTSLTAVAYSFNASAVRGPSNLFPSEGSVGIGVTSPDEKLQVVGIIHSSQGGFKFPDGTVQTTASSSSLTTAAYVQTMAVADYAFSIKNIDMSGHGARFETTGSTTTALYSKGGENGLAADFQGKVILRSWKTAEPIMELGEGLDFAEGFGVSKDVAAVPGTVMIINPDDPGKLTISSKPYDTRVAGIIAGANGLESGVRLGGEKFLNALAVAGRVYCNVDASQNGVEPGDLLTTSAIPGYAMKAANADSAHGAILGKAMEKMVKGKEGKILVLVSLQ